MVLNESTLVDSGKAHSFDSFIEPRWLNANANSKYQPQQDDVEQLVDPLQPTLIKNLEKACCLVM
jgi:hypothetical protein